MKSADSVIPCCVTCVVNDLVASFVELVTRRNATLRHIGCHARVISGYHWRPVYSGIVFSTVCIPLDVTTGTSNAKRGSFHICRYWNNKRLIIQKRQGGIFLMLSILDKHHYAQLLAKLKKCCRWRSEPP